MISTVSGIVIDLKPVQPSKAFDKMNSIPWKLPKSVIDSQCANVYFPIVVMFVANDTFLSFLQL